MPSTITEKILARHCGKTQVKPWELINADIDVVLCHDVTTPPAIDMLNKRNIKKVFDPEKVVVTPDHFVPNKDIESAELAKRLREWVHSNKIKNYYKIGNHGVCHAILPEQGHVTPSSLIIGADSHTCTYGALGAFSTGVGSTDLAAALATGKLWFKVPETIKFIINGKLPKGVYSKDIILHIISDIGVDGALYKAMEFTGSTIDELSIEARMTITNMAIEAGAKSGIMQADDKVKAYLKEKTSKKFEIVKSDKDATYLETKEYDISNLEPIVTVPNLPSNGKFISELKKGIKVDQAYLGSCTNGRIEDLRVAADILKGKKIAENTRMIVVPATTDIWKQANKEGLLDIFMEFGATVSTPTCGACLGGHMGILAEGEICISSTNRNFTGRMGHPKSEVYLASPATVAASAIEGKIADPRRYL
ncbi:MAG: 3-isopropylmalate dehydratase large subunit [Candidatus Woesearchaeota archaeon]|jgi:3-isopropylmalate/(R)-2-methylmalate dehydratase large subunit|nr:3-isopropylmalate dehydratase large subunit [Candidatus Woesearchaeota archaeon]